MTRCYILRKKGLTLNRLLYNTVYIMYFWSHMTAESDTHWKPGNMFIACLAAQGSLPAREVPLDTI
jgi:hypothetical protein